MNHRPECIDVWYMNRPLGEDVQVCSNEAPRVMYGPASGA